MLVTSLILLGICLVSKVTAKSVRRGVFLAPEIDDGDTVQFFIVESSFPYNAPQNIRDTAGKNFEKYAITHAGLGVWDTKTDNKFTIEFVSVDYAGSLLPYFDETNKQLIWNNTGNIVFTSPTEETDWLSAQMICETSGVTYNQLISYLEDNHDLFTIFQPVQAVYYNLTEVMHIADYTNTQLQERVKVHKKDSFWFVNTLVKQLNLYGADTKTFLDIYGATFQYILSDNTSPEVISWVGTSSLNSVYRWYQELDECYQVAFNASSTADSFLKQIKGCYGGYAYIYKSDTSVYNVSLGNLSSVFVTPNLQRYIFDLPDSGDKSKNRLQVIDFVLMAAAALLIFIGAGIILRKLCVKKRRRRVSMDGEDVATRVVDRIAGEHLHDENEQKVYYRGRPSSWDSMWSYISAPTKRNKKASSKHGGDSSHHGKQSSAHGNPATTNNNNSGLGISSVSQHYSEDSDSSTSDLVRPLAGTNRSNSTHSGVADSDTETTANSSRGGGYVSPNVPGASSVDESSLKSYTSI